MTKLCPDDIKTWFAKCDILERHLGDVRRAVEGYQHILGILPPENRDKYIELARQITKVSVSIGWIRYTKVVFLFKLLQSNNVFEYYKHVI